ncbi:TIGR02444 family protein [Modicisalibacter sp. 'Wilcox']|uniref:TIGR02444 family protein n=1 Tax=Modicisalibacter sp. 'Wilcox' TaxID=2679914 RepID=UPI0013CFF768|nr:TIGR02444 family protein [Modicisalibacter sp. 'Wilcox']
MTAHSTQSVAALAAPDALWRYAGACYAAPGVADACLAAQDGLGADVCELLWLAWLYRLGLTTAEDASRALAPVRTHQARHTRTLRARRRALKPLARPGSAIEAWRERLKRDELDAEHAALDALQALARHGDGVRARYAEDGDLVAIFRRHLGIVTERDQPVLASLARALEGAAAGASLPFRDE